MSEKLKARWMAEPEVDIGVDLGGQPGRGPPIIELGGKGILLPPQ